MGWRWSDSLQALGQFAPAPWGGLPRTGCRLGLGGQPSRPLAAALRVLPKDLCRQAGSRGSEPATSASAG